MVRHRKYQVNMNFVKTWSDDLAYCLGFITADGSVDKYSMRIELHRKDEEALRFVRDKLSPTSPIKQTHKNKAARLSVNSVELVKLLNQYNIFPRKTGREKMPVIPSEFLPSYIRGIFDGDGWVYLRRNSAECGICSASKTLLEQIRQATVRKGKVRPRQKKKMTLYQWDLYGSHAVAFRDFIYTGGFSLTRKRERFFSEFYIPSPSRWTDEQIAYLRNHYRPKTKGCLQAVGSAIGKSRKAVSKKVWELGLASPICGV